MERPTTTATAMPPAFSRQPSHTYLWRESHIHTTYTWRCICIYVSMYLSIYLTYSISLSIYVCICTYIYIHIRICIYIYMYVYLYAPVYIYIYTHANTHTYIYIYTRIFAQLCVCMCERYGSGCFSEGSSSVQGLHTMRLGSRTSLGTAWTMPCHGCGLHSLRSSQGPKEIALTPLRYIDVYIVYPCQYSII